MQLDTTSALLTALISSVIGFGFAFYLERKIRSRVQTKLQRILVYVAMVSLGFGLTAVLNELFGFPLQGLRIRYERVISYFVANILFVPALLLVIVWAIKPKSLSQQINEKPQSLVVRKNLFFVFLSGALAALAILYIGFRAANAPMSDTTYDFYFASNPNDCNSSFDSKPNMSVRFLYKKESNEVFMLYESAGVGDKKQGIEKLDNCSIIDEKNWSCGGDVLVGGYVTGKYTLVNGVFSYGEGYFGRTKTCPIRIVKR